MSARSIAFKVTRNADLVIEEEEAEDFLELLEQGIRARRKGDFVRLTLEHNDDARLNSFLISHVRTGRSGHISYIRLAARP